MRIFTALTRCIPRVLAALAAMMQPWSVYLVTTLIWIRETHADVPPDPLIFVDMPVRIDPARPLKIGPEFYPAESTKLREEGKCVVRMAVDKAGDIHDPKIITSSGFERLDAACIAAASSGHLLPAMKNGVPIDSTTDMPIVWTLPKSSTLAECMAIPASLPSASTQTDAAAKPKGPKNEISARVVLRLFVSETGAVDGVKVDRSSGYTRLDDAAIKGVTGQKMKPAMFGGQAIASCVTMPIVWNLK
jgi:TonB family protein